MLIKKYLKELFEPKRAMPDRKPSPSFAYEVVYGKPPPGVRRGRPPFPTKHKTWNGMEIDYNLDIKVLEKLNNIPNVEIRGSCEGHNEDWVTYVAFRVSEKLEDKNTLNRIKKKLNSYDNTFCGWELGVQRRPRFVVASKLYYSKDNYKEWKSWWEKLPKRLDNSVNS